MVISGNACFPKGGGPHILHPEEVATMAYEGMIAETLSINGDKNEPISAYVARPLGPGPFPGIVLIHHMPGWDEWYRETTRKFAHHGYAAIELHAGAAPPSVGRRRWVRFGHRCRG